MGKINVLLVAIILSGYFTANCRNNSVSADNNAKALSTDLDRTAVKVIFDDVTCTTFFGRWHYVYNDENQNFTLKLGDDGGKVVGTHCFVYGRFGDKIDCPDENSIHGICNGDYIKATVHSDWANDPISIEIKLVGKDTLSLKPLSDAGQSFIQMEMLFVKEQ